MLRPFYSLFERNGSPAAVISGREVALTHRNASLTSQKLAPSRVRGGQKAAGPDPADRRCAVQTALNGDGPPLELLRVAADKTEGSRPDSAVFSPTCGTVSAGNGAGTPPAEAAPQIVNAMTIDVEDYFQVSAFSQAISVEDWDRLQHRVVANTQAVLELLDESKSFATFFVLGWIAERYPGLVRQIAESGHEIASHGYAHRRVGEQSPGEFLEDVSRTKKLLEDASGLAIKGYRAASFSLDSSMTWAYEALATAGYDYSSSVYPIRHDHYGAPDAPRRPFSPAADIGIIELPLTTTRILKRNFPCAGGGYFRLLPYPVSVWALRRVNAKERTPGIFYFHPWEIDPGQPRMRPCSVRTRARHYLNLASMRGKLRRLLAEFRWDRMDLVYGLRGTKP